MNHRVIVLLLAVCLGWVGCTTNHYRKSANRETYKVIAEKSSRVKNMDPHFTIEQTNSLSLERLPVVNQIEEALGQAGEAERGAQILSLEQALDIAVKHSRIYQASKEQLFIQAMTLTLDRHQFAPIFFGRGNAADNVTTEQATRVGIDPATLQPRVELSDELVEQHRGTASASFGIGQWLIRTGGRLSASFSTDFLRFLTGDPRTLTSSQLGANLVQPLWRGAGYRATMENLTQSERNLLYALRDFTQFRKRFSVDIATAYYGVIQNRDTVRNSYLNLQSSKKTAEQARELAKEGRQAQADLGRLEQQELATESAWINAVRSYKQSLDNFKIQLGLTTDASVVLDDKELEQLTILHPDLAVEDALQVALANRLDYYNVRDQNQDTSRRIYLAANGLKPQIDLVSSAGFNSRQERGTGFPVPDLDRYRWNAGLNLDLPLERKAQRNTYRAALIAHEASARALIQREDEIKLQVRDSWRALDQAKRTYEISEIAVKLAERRVEEQNLLAELGRARAQDQVDAQNDLISAKNQLTQALVGHTIARLQFWNNMGILYIKDNGQWEEVTDAKQLKNP